MVTVKIGRCLLQDLLHSRDMNQIELSEITGISPVQINGYIQGKRKAMSMLTAKRIAIALNCSIEDLYQWEY